MIKKCFICFFVMFSFSFQNLNAQDFAISVADSDQLYPDVAFDGTNFWTVWVDKRSGTSQIYGARITPQGQLLDTNGILLASFPDTGYTMPSVAFGDSVGCIVFYIEPPAWHDSLWLTFKNVGITRFQKNGNLIDTTPKFIDGWNYPEYAGRYNENMLSVVYGEHHFFFFLEYIAACNSGGWWEMFLYSEVQALGESGLMPIEKLPGFHSWTPAGVWNGKKFFVVWDELALGPSGLGAEGVFIDDSLIEQSVDSSQFKIRGEEEFPSGMFGGIISENHRDLAFSGSRYLLVSEIGDYLPDKIWYDVLSDSGKPIDSLPAIIDNGSLVYQRLPTCTYSDGKFIAVWQDSASASVNLYGAIIDTFGAIIDTGYITHSSIRKLQPSLTTGAGKTLLVWADNRNGDFNIYGSFMSPDSIGVESPSNPQSTSLSTTLRINQNPFIKNTIISYSILSASKVSLAIYDITGSCVKTLVDGEKAAGSYSVPLSATDLKTGIYFLRLTTGAFNTTKKITIIK